MLKKVIKIMILILVTRNIITLHQPNKVKDFISKSFYQIVIERNFV